MRWPTRSEWVALAAWLTAFAGTAILLYRLATVAYIDPFTPAGAGRLDLLLGATLGAITVVVLTVFLLRADPRLFRGESPSHVLLQLPLATLLLVDGDRVVRYANDAITALLGFAPNELVGYPFDDLFDRDSRAILAPLFAHPRPGEPAGVAEVRGSRKDGRAVPLQVVVQSARWQGQPVWGVLLQDLAEREKLVVALAARGAELARSNRELEQFTYIASHDLQEPLRMVGSYTQLLQRRYGQQLDADANEFLRYAQEGASRMRDLIDDLLEYSRLGTRPGTTQRVAVDAVLRRVLANLRESIAEAHAEVTCGPMPEVEGDPTQLAQLFQNLIGNAIKFRGDHPPHVRVTAERRGASWEFAVQDDGIGISPEYQDRIFVIFQRLHSREEYPGTGIGLAVVRKVVERHGGRVWVESSGRPGEGTTFRFTIPVDRARAPEPSPATPDPGAARLQGRATSLIEDRLKELV
ncbi:MAG TPA: ATP-binding protein [Thermoplasmata archaeon]|nr:ATP-binding protein [Thermoplasmata archaeon]